MTQRPVNFSRNICRSCRPWAEEYLPANDTRRPTLFGVNNKERLALESSRVRLISRRINPDEPAKDFAAYFESSQKHYSPNYAVTSHTSPTLRKQSHVVPTYPMVQSLRWNPYVESSSIDDLQSDIEEKIKDCSCKKCYTKDCISSKVNSSSTARPSSFRNNIMTFSDRYTMTPRLVNTGCGCAIVPSTRESVVSVTGSDIATKDTDTKIDLNRFYHAHNPTSILKRNYRRAYDIDSNAITCRNYSNGYDVLQQLQEPEKKQQSYPVGRVVSSRSFLKCKQQIGTENNRRMLYNEGISEAAANRHPVMPMTVPSSTNLRSLQKYCSKVSVRSGNGQRCNLNNSAIPFSHRKSFKYHQECKSSDSKPLYYDDEKIDLDTSSGLSRKIKGAIKLPKKVLTSDRDIDTFVDRSYPRVAVPAAGRRKKN